MSRVLNIVMNIVSSNIHTLSIPLLSAMHSTMVKIIKLAVDVTVLRHYTDIPYLALLIGSKKIEH